MTIDLTKLREAVLEELKLMSEINPAHDEKGRWAKKGKGKTYSLTKNALDDVGPNSELEVPARGSITSKGKVSSKFGMNTGDEDKQCGRLTIDGSKKKKTRSCKDCPKDYWDESKDSDDEELLDAVPLPVEDDDELELGTEKKSTPGRIRQKKETEKRNRFKNRNDLVPRLVDSPSVRQDKLFGDQALYSLARGIVSELEQEEDEFPRWEGGKLKENPREKDILNPADDAYLAALVRREIKAALKSVQTTATQQRGRGCSWPEIMRAVQDIETAQKGHKEPKAK